MCVGGGVIDYFVMEEPIKLFNKYQCLELAASLIEDYGLNLVDGKCGLGRLVV